MLSSRVHRAPPPPRAGGARNPARLTAAAVPAAARGQPDARIAVKLGLARSLGKLDLSDMGLESLPAEVFELDELEELSLAGNRLQSLPDDITRLTALRKLGLAGNLLGSLPEGLGALTGLEGLWLHGNLLAALPESLGNLKALRQLSVAGNRRDQHLDRGLASCSHAVVMLPCLKSFETLVDLPRTFPCTGLSPCRTPSGV